MSFVSSFDAKQRVKQAVDIVDLVGSYMSLRREGRGFKAICPWHDDTRPSLQVNPERQSFKCWVCDIGGDIFSFVMKIEGVTFPEALSMLADRANISLQADPRQPKSQPADDKRVLYQAMTWALQQYHACLLKDEAAAGAREYLSQRRITAESIRKFQLGFAPDEWSWIVERSSGTPYSAAVLERVGLIGRRRQGPGYYDRFRGRVLFPIFDSQNRAVGVGGRVLPKPEPVEAAKYVNSPETPLFSKSNLLYGLNWALDAIRKANTVLVTEGYTDCIAAHQAGLQNTVAVLGTALGASHVQLLRRFSDRLRVVLVLDGDEAGRRRAKEVLELFVAANVDLRVLTLPDELDPAEFLERHGVAAFQSLVDNSVDALTHAFRAATAGIDLTGDLHASNAALQQLVATIAKAPRLRSDTEVEDRLREERFLQRLSADFRVSEAEVRKLLTETRRKRWARDAVKTEAADASVRERIDPLERELLEILLQLPQMYERISVIQPEQLASASCREVLSLCAQLWSQGILPSFDRLLLEIDDSGIKNLLVELDESGRDKARAENETRLRDVLAGFERRPREHWALRRTDDLKQRRLAEEEELAALLELERHHRARQQQHDPYREGISEPTDGKDTPTG